jgi:hypothetical protein
MSSPSSTSIAPRAASPLAHARLLSIDAYRGLVMLLMTAEVLRFKQVGRRGTVGDADGCTCDKELKIVNSSILRPGATSSFHPIWLASAEVRESEPCCWFPNSHRTPRPHESTVSF